MISYKNKSGFNNTAFGWMILADASAPPISSNEGGTTAAEYAAASQSSISSRMVIRGESFDNKSHQQCKVPNESLTTIEIPELTSTHEPKLDGEAYSAITDFLNCTFQFDEYNFESIVFELCECLGKSFTQIKDRFKGLHGWKNSLQLGETKTFLAYGGQNNTAFLSIPGEACHMVTSWLNLATLIGEKYNGKITRWDGAVDDYEGLHSVDSAVQLYLDDKFNAGGKKPSCDQKGNWLIPDGTGRTFYVGKRKNGKLLRVYEKGMQLGSKWHPWVRWEVELHSIDRVIPWNVLLEPGKYVAGSYPKATGWIQDEMSRIKTLQKNTRISYNYLTACASISYGKHLNVMLEIEGSPEKVIEKLIRSGIPKRLDLPIPAKNEGWDK